MRSSFSKLVPVRRGRAHPEDLGRRTRAPRVAIEPLHAIWLVRTSPTPLRILPVANISTTGIGFVRDAEAAWPDVDATIAGTLVVGRASFPTTLRVVHLTGGIVGCAFVSPSAELAAALEQHLRAELETLGLFDRREPVHRTTFDVIAHTFTGRHSSELYLVERRGRVLFFGLTFHGHYLEGGAERPVRFGVLSGKTGDDEDPDGAIEWLEMIDAEQLEVTVRCIASMAGLEPAYREGILEHLC